MLFCGAGPFSLFCLNCDDGRKARQQLPKHRKSVSYILNFAPKLLSPSNLHLPAAELSFIAPSHLKGAWGKAPAKISEVNCNHLFTAVPLPVLPYTEVEGGTQEELASPAE